MKLDREKAWSEFQALMPEGSTLDSGYEWDWMDRALERAEDELDGGKSIADVELEAMCLAAVYRLVALEVRCGKGTDVRYDRIRGALEDAEDKLQDGKSLAQVVHDNLVVGNAYLASAKALQESSGSKAE